MRIAFPMFFLGKAGGVKVIVRLADASILRGHDVTLLVPRREDMPPSPTSAKIEVVPPFPVPIVRHFLPTIMPGVSFPYAKRLRNFDAIVANLGATCLSTQLVGKADVKKYYVVQQDETVFFSPISLEYWVTRLSYTAFDEGHVFVVSKWLNDVVRKRCGFESTILPPGIDHHNFHPRKRAPHSGKHVLVLSRNEKWRGLQVFLSAMEMVKRDVDDVKIIAVGHHGRPLRTSCPVDYVRPSDEELADLYSSCDAFVLPSFLEGLPVPPLEAMACGGAVVVTDCLGTRDYCVDGENCLVVPPGDPHALSGAIVRVIEEEGLSSRLRMNGPPTAAPWTYDRMGRIFLETVESG